MLPPPSPGCAHQQGSGPAARGPGAAEKGALRTTAREAAGWRGTAAGDGVERLCDRGTGSCCWGGGGFYWEGGRVRHLAKKETLRASGRAAAGASRLLLGRVRRLAGRKLLLLRGGGGCSRCLAAACFLCGRRQLLSGWGQRLAGGEMLLVEGRPAAFSERLSSGRGRRLTGWLRTAAGEE